MYNKYLIFRCFESCCLWGMECWNCGVCFVGLLGTLFGSSLEICDIWTTLNLDMKKLLFRAKNFNISL
jgi:cytosine/uracil/thiamine/allantoin permease